MAMTTSWITLTMLVVMFQTQQTLASTLRVAVVVLAVSEALALASESEVEPTGWVS